MNACRRPSSRIVMHVYTFFTNYVQGVAEIEIGSIGILYSTLVGISFFEHNKKYYYVPLSISTCNIQ